MEGYPILEPQRLGDFGWYVLIEWSAGVARHVHEFRTEAEARSWIECESEAWLKKQWDAKEADAVCAEKK
jgi:hypothetical protein